MPRSQSKEALLAEIAAQLTPKRRFGPQGEKPLIAIERGSLPSVGKVFGVGPAWILSHLSDTQINTACHVLWGAAQRYLEAEGWSFARVRLITIKPDGSVQLAFSKLVGTTADMKIGEMLQRYGSESMESSVLS